MHATFVPAVRRLAVASALALSTLTCGPSFQAVYECDVQFEHCYGLDMGTGPSDAKRACWRSWFASYTYGQSRDRVEYATTRLGQLSTDPATVGPGPSATAPALAAGSPLPKDAFVPPPNVSDGRSEGLSAADAGASNKSAHEIAASAPGSECTEACSRRWSSCYRSCRDGECNACDRAYRACMPPCFREEPTSRASPVRSRH